MPRFAYFGTPYVARDTLAALLDAGFTPALVITSPDAPRGRGLAVTPSETRALAEERGLPVITPARLDDAAIAEITAAGAEYAIVVAYGKILPEALIRAFPRGVLNVHYSLLPKYRGASPVECALLHGDQETGVAIQRMVFELDAGDLLALRKTPIAPEETTRELRPRLVSLGAELLVETLPAYLAGEIAPRPQEHALATRCGKIKKEAGELSLAGDPRENWNRYRAYAESPGTYFFMTREERRLRVKIRGAEFREGHFVPLRVVPEGKGETDYALLLKSGWRPA
jgi:methionyl-tRNA formyltransferase